MDILPDLIEFDWDSGNINKNFLSHNVTNEEAEEVFNNLPLLMVADSKHSSKEERTLLLGKSNSERKLSIIFTMRSNKIRVISARDMNKRERKFYEETIKTDTSI